MKNHRNITTKPRRSQAQWQQLLAEFESQHCTVAEFCKMQQVSSSSFYKWKQKLSGHVNASEQPLFVQVQQNMCTQLGAEPTWDVELTLGAGMVLRISKPC